MNRLLLLSAAMFIAGSVGCDMVTLDGPIGDPLSRAEKAAFVGRWINEDSEICEIRLTNDEKLVLGSLSWDDEQQRHRAQNHVIDSRKVGDAVYFLAHDDPNDISFARIERVGESEFKMYAPDAAKFRAAVERGILRGEIIPKKNDNYTVRINVDSPLTKPVFAAVDFSDWYLDDGTIAFRRIKRFDETNGKAEPSDPPKSPVGREIK